MIGKLVRGLVKETVMLPANVVAGAVDAAEEMGKMLDPGDPPPKRPKP